MNDQHSSIIDKDIAEITGELPKLGEPLIGGSMPNPKRILKVAQNPLVQQVGGVLVLGLMVYGIASYFDGD